MEEERKKAIKSFRDLQAYERAYQASLEIHRVSLAFPKYEQYELGGQVRRASKSVAMNIAEGFAKNALPEGSLAEFKRFVMMALGSADEVRVQLDYCEDLGYISREDHDRFEREYVTIGKMLTKMLQTWH